MTCFKGISVFSPRGLIAWRQTKPWKREAKIKLLSAQPAQDQKKVIWSSHTVLIQRTEGGIWRRVRMRGRRRASPKGFNSRKSDAAVVRVWGDTSEKDTPCCSPQTPSIFYKIQTLDLRCARCWPARKRENVISSHAERRQCNSFSNFFQLFSSLVFFIFAQRVRIFIYLFIFQSKCWGGESVWMRQRGAVRS